MNSEIYYNMKFFNVNQVFGVTEVLKNQITWDWGFH